MFFKKKNSVLEKAENKKTVCLDFDGVIHSYKSGWKGIDETPDEPVEGIENFIKELYDNNYNICIFSSRSKEEVGINAMKNYVASLDIDNEIYNSIQWPQEKPPAHIYIDDRAFAFKGKFPAISEIDNFKAWMKKSSSESSSKKSIDLFKAKYIKKIPKSGGGFTYIYKENERKKINEEKKYSIVNSVKNIKNLFEKNGYHVRLNESKSTNSFYLNLSKKDREGDDIDIKLRISDHPKVDEKNYRRKETIEKWEWRNEGLKETSLELETNKEDQEINAYKKGNFSKTNIIDIYDEVNNLFNRLEKELNEPVKPIEARPTLTLEQKKEKIKSISNKILDKKDKINEIEEKFKPIGDESSRKLYLFGNIKNGRLEIPDPMFTKVYLEDDENYFNFNQFEVGAKKIDRFIKEMEYFLNKSLTFSGHPLEGRQKFQGMDISLEHKVGSTREGVDKMKIIKSVNDIFVKSKIDRSKLRKEVVTNKKGHRQTVWRKVGEDIKDLLLGLFGGKYKSIVEAARKEYEINNIKDKFNITMGEWSVH